MKSPNKNAPGLEAMEHKNIVMVAFLLDGGDQGIINYDTLKNITVFGPQSQCYNPWALEE